MEVDNDVIISRLDSIKEELNYIRDNMVEKDEIMTSDEFEAYKNSFSKKDLVSLKDVKDELEL